MKNRSTYDCQNIANRQSEKFNERKLKEKILIFFKSQKFALELFGFLKKFMIDTSLIISTQFEKTGIICIT